MIGEKIPIQIYGRNFDIDVEGITPLEANALANYVTEKMKEIESQTKIVDTSKLAMLAALNIADELFRIKRQKENTSDISERKIEEMISILQPVVEPRTGSQ